MRIKNMPRRAYQAIAALIGVGLLVALGFSLSALFTSRTQQPVQPVNQPIEERSSEVAAEQFPPSPVEEIIQPDSTAGWEVYRNEEHGFEMQYPVGFVVRTENLPPLVTAVVKGAVVRFKLADSKYYSGTNLREASVIVGVREGRGVAEACSKLQPGSVHKRDLYNNPNWEGLPKAEINSVTFYKDFIEEGATGDFIEKTSYRSVRGGTCYEIALFIHYTNLGVFDPGTIAEFNSEAVTKRLEQVLSTFRFLK